MAKKILVQGNEWQKKGSDFSYCHELENGNIVVFPKTPFPFPQESIDFLLSQRQSGSKSRKNIAYKPKEDRITNHESKSRDEAEKLRAILRDYSQNVTAFLSKLLSPYASRWKLDYASFRPFQEKGRKMRTRARNDLLHCDAFPTRPLHGSRILRFFTNINPIDSRHWITSHGFADLAKAYLDKIDVPPSVSFDRKSAWRRKWQQWMHAGFKIPLRSPYDHIMLRMHHFLKENSTFQETCHKDHWDFPPGSCWMVFTDQVSHAALSGQYALEQTFIVPHNALLCPEKSPVSVLERLTGKNLVDFDFLRSVQ